MVFTWIPSHVGVRGNELADTTAKEAALADRPDIVNIPYQEMSNYYKGLTRCEWQRRWGDVAANKLRAIKDCALEIFLPSMPS